jgi:hypothetical protein
MCCRLLNSCGCPYVGGQTPPDLVSRLGFHLQGFAGALASIHKALWGSGGKWADERLPIRAALEVGND